MSEETEAEVEFSDGQRAEEYLRAAVSAASRARSAIVKPFRRGPIETATGYILVKLDVQHDTEDCWSAKIHNTKHVYSEGKTREEAIQNALRAASKSTT